MRTGTLRLPLVFVCALALGLIAWAADRVPSDSAMPIAAGLGNLPSHWLGTAFLIGAISREKLPGAAYAALGLALAVAVYYTSIEVFGDRPGADIAGAAQAWLAVSLIAGPVFGLAGAVWIGGPGRFRPWSVALLSGALAGEAMYLAAELDMVSGFSLRDTPTVLAVMEIGVAASLPFLMLRDASDRLIALAFTCFCAILMAFSIAVVIEGVRGVLSRG